MYAILKHTHLTALLISFTLFFIRGILMMRESNASNNRVFLIAPHIVNLILIGTGICLAVVLHLNPTDQPWLTVKLIALVVYIVLGVLTFKHSSMATRKALWISALIVFAFIISVAINKNPLGFLAPIF